jgi:hypothetical protein
MPIYEYYCPDNNKIYSFYARTFAQGQTIPPCPDDPGFRMVKMVSSFAIGSGGEKEAPAPGGGPDGGDESEMDDPGMMAAMSEMEREMASMDEENPDPRQMARMMRRMAELSGEGFDEGMEEMVRKLEEGQDPDKLEEELGEVLGDGGEGDDGGYGGFGRSARGAPTRDPHLYDY